MGIFEINATLIAELVLFAIVVAVVTKVVVPPLRRAMRERQAIIAKGLADAQAAEARLVEADREYQGHLDQARREGREILDAYRAMAATMTAEAPERLGRDRAAVPSKSG